MSMWTYARIDRIESGEVHCIFCNRALRSGRTIVIHDESGVEAFAGPACAKKYVEPATTAILDLSRMAMLLVLKGAEDPSSTPSSPDDDVKANPKARRQALEVDEVADYLRLRAEHMAGFTGNLTQRLRDLHVELNSQEGLSDPGRLYVERLLSKSRAANTIYSVRNVERCIGAVHWLKIAIEHTKPERRDFLGKMLHVLRENWRLSSKQVEAVNKWGEGVRKQVHNYPHLDVMAFNDVQTPRFGAPQNSSN
jgi:hypothetical protein